MSLSYPKCNFFTIQNQNPYYAVYCLTEKRLVMTIHCQSCRENGSNPNIKLYFEEGSFHIQVNTKIDTKPAEKKGGLDLFLSNE